MLPYLGPNCLLDKVDMLSVNQMHAQIKLTEMWKIVHTNDHPIKVEIYKHAAGTAVTRSANTTTLVECGKSDISQKTFINNAVLVWNLAPITITKCISLNAAKKAIKSFVKTLPI